MRTRELRLVTWIVISALLFMGRGSSLAQEPTPEPRFAQDGSAHSRQNSVSYDNRANPQLINELESSAYQPAASTGSAQIIEYGIPVSPTNLLVNQAGDVWFSSFYQNAIGKLDTITEQVTVYSRQDDDGNVWAVEQDSTGDIWYTTVNASDDVVGKFDPSTNTFQEWAVPDIEEHFGLEIDPVSADVWFASHGGGISKLSPATGSIDIWATSVYTDIYDLDIASDGSIWFSVQPYGNQGVGNLNPTTGEVNVWEMPIGGSRPFRVVATTSDEIWFTEYATVANSIAKLVPSTNALNEFQVPVPDSFPGGLVKDSDRIWFTARGANSIGQLQPSLGSPVTHIISPLTIQAIHTAASIAPSSYTASVQVTPVDVMVKSATTDLYGGYTMFVLPTSDSRPFDVTVSSSTNEAWFTASGAAYIAKLGAIPLLELTGIEITQGIQKWENDVVLIQDRPTFVRAHIRSTSGAKDDVTAELIGRRNGSELPGSPLKPANIGGNIDVLQNPNRSQLNDSFYFELPESWRNGTIEFEFRGDSDTIACREHAGTDDDCKAEVTFTQSPAADVSFVGIIWRESDTKHQPTWGDIYEVVQEVESTFPIPELDWDRPYDIEPAFFAGQPSSAWQFIRLNTMLKVNRALDGCISSWPVNCNRYYLGILIDPPRTGVMGMADGIPADVAAAYLTDRFTPAHELGHAAGRRHTTCTGNEGGPDPSYPYPGGEISQDDSGDNAFYGFNISTKRIYGPSVGDLMSYCGPPRWPSDWTYSHIRDHLVSRYGTSALSLALLAGEPAVLVSGVVTPTEATGNLDSVYVVESPVSASAPVPGTYTIRFEDSGAQELASYSFEPDYGIESCVGCTDDDESNMGTFALLLPWNSSTARIVLLRDTQQLDSRIASDSTPIVNVTYPNGGESLSGSTATLSWSASDLDGDPLEYAVQYSTDAGSSWQTLVSAWSSTTFELNLDVIAGTDQALLRVLASDGFNTSQDESDGTFTVAKHSPQANIQTPENSSLYIGDQTIILEGSAFDSEDGQLSDTALSWSSGLDGVLGTGQSLTIVASTLTEGTHTITLTAEDGDGQTDTASITVQVYRERPTLPTTLAVAPDALSFVAVRDGGQAAWQSLSIRNDGDGTMTWSANADQSWILMSFLGGTAPTDITVATDPTGLTIGEYTGNITISAPGAANSPQAVEVTMHVREPYVVYLPLILR